MRESVLYLSFDSQRIFDGRRLIKQSYSQGGKSIKLQSKNMRKNYVVSYLCAKATFALKLRGKGSMREHIGISCWRVHKSNFRSKTKVEVG